MAVSTPTKENNAKLYARQIMMHFPGRSKHALEITYSSRKREMREAFDVEKVWDKELMKLIFRMLL